MSFFYSLLMIFYFSFFKVCILFSLLIPSLPLLFVITMLPLTCAMSNSPFNLVTFLHDSLCKEVKEDLTFPSDLSLISFSKTLRSLSSSRMSVLMLSREAALNKCLITRNVSYMFPHWKLFIHAQTLKETQRIKIY